MTEYDVRIGETKISKYGSKMTIMKYNNSRDVWIKFSNCVNLINAAYVQFQRGTIRSPYDKTVYGIGYLGEGDYKASIDRKQTKPSATWRSMMQRCYCKTFHDKNPAYVNCEVDERWHNFQTYAAWFDENYYEVEGEKMALDKDILVKGNKVYSPDRCIFVPKEINNLFTKNESRRGKYPIGVCWDKTVEKYKSTIRSNEKSIIIGYFNTVEESFKSYKLHKENYIKEVANKYKGRIPEKLYDAMMKYIVEITD